MSLIKSKKRVADHGEVFTPAWMVETILDLVKGETERIDSRFLESACGSGNFPVRIFQRKLAAVELKLGKLDVSTQEWNRKWTDEDLFAKDDISASEIASIEKVVRPVGAFDE